jgi:hypothetical protein
MVLRTDARNSREVTSMGCRVRSKKRYCLSGRELRKLRSSSWFALWL